MKTSITSVDDGTLNSGKPYPLITGTGATLPQRRFGAIRLLSPSTNLVYVGGSDILNDGTLGFQMDSSFPTLAIDLDPGDTLYAIAAAGQTVIVHAIYNQT